MTRALLGAMGRRAGTYASFVKLSHTIFAAPFAVAAALLATRRPHLPLTFARALALAVCLVAARTAAMAWNRIVDRDIDASNPRTATREIPVGVVSARQGVALTVAAVVVFVTSASTLGRAPMLLALPVMLVLLGYSYAKRFTWGSHLWLGLALALAPGGAWIAMGAAPEPGIVALMVAVACWVAGFDVLYSLQDEAFDRAHGLRSVPARFGGRGAVFIARTLHVVTVVALVTCGRLLHGGVFFGAATCVIAALLVYEHRLVRPRSDGTVPLDRLDRAFFDVNGWVSLAFLALVAIDVWTTTATTALSAANIPTH